MVNDSSTGGIIQPTSSSSSPLEGQDLNRFLQPGIVALTTLPQDKVIQSYQGEVPNIPQAGDAWCAFWYQHLNHDNSPYIGQEPDINELQRHELLQVIIDFFDLGTNGLASKYATLLRDNLAIPQNKEWLVALNFNLVHVSAPLVIPVLFKQRWQYRERTNIYLKRNVVRQYPVLDLLKGQVTMKVGSVTITRVIAN